MRTKILLLVFLLTTVIIWGQGLKTDGKKIIDQNGKEVILRGMGLGGWMLQEGYMMQASDVADTQHEFRDRLISLIGKEKTDEFYDTWLENHVTKKDIDSLAKWGFNSVRLPMHYNLFTLPIEEEPVKGSNTWLTKGFDMVDDLLGWCASNNMYLILDLHAAPGGQGANAAISDYDPSKPSLWESVDNQNKTIALWRKLADRYKDEPWIGGYDLLNEVNWTLPGNTQLRSLYMDITNSIREVDTKHIIFIEGNSFANDFTGLTPVWDDNMAYSFHKYWSHNNQGSIQWVLDLREKTNVPLWMGEAGENSNVWFTDAIKLFEDNNIGWSWWPMKRIETIVSPYSITFSEGYKKILSYWRNEGPQPTAEEAYQAIMELAVNTNSDNCTYQKDVPDAMIRQITTDATIPYSHHSIPGVVHMSDFDLGKINEAYYDVDHANYSLSTGEFQAWNSGWIYRNDAVDVQAYNDAVNSNGYYVGFIKKDEWLNYTVDIDESAVYKAEVRLAAQNNGGKFHLSLDGEEITTTQTVSATGGWEKFATYEINEILLEQGRHELKLSFIADAEFNISSIKFSKTAASTESSFKALNGHTGDNNTIEITVNQPVQTASVNGSKDYFSLWINGAEQTITEVTTDINKSRTIIISTDKTLLYTDEIQVSYNGSVINSASDKSLETFTDLMIRNTVTPLFILPGKIEAEEFMYMEGLAVETTTDDGGGYNIGYTDPDDYADYTFYTENGGSYKANFRLAAQNDAGQIGLYLVDDNSAESELLTVTTPVTGGWQTWETISGNLNLPKGTHTLRMKIISGGFNMNWMDFELLQSNDDSDGDGIDDDDDDCPNTEAGATVNDKGCAIFTLAADNFSIEAIGETCPDRKNGKIVISAATSHNYQLNFNGIVQNFSTSITLGSLVPGFYDFCIAVEGEAFNQCFSLEIAQGLTVSGKSNITGKNAKIEIDQGTAPYRVYKNGQRILETMSAIFSIGVNHGDLLEVKTAVDCEGVFTERIAFGDSNFVYPNPTEGKFEIAMPGTEGNVAIQIYTITGQLISGKNYDVQYGKVQLDLSHTPSGIYLIKIYSDKPEVLKLIKQ